MYIIFSNHHLLADDFFYKKPFLSKKIVYLWLMFYNT